MHLFPGTAVACLARRLRLALQTVRRTIETDMEVPVVAQPRLDLAQPGAIVPGFAAKRLLDGSVHEYSGDLRILRRGLDQRNVRRRPQLRVDILAVLGDHYRGHHLFTLFSRQLVVGHRREPDIRVPTDLMARVDGEHPSATRL